MISNIDMPVQKKHCNSYECDTYMGCFCNCVECKPPSLDTPYRGLQVQRGSQDDLDDERRKR